MTGKVLILRGIPGSGKSTYVQQLIQRREAAWVMNVSADHFFMRDGQYQWDRSKLGEAHGSCLRAFAENVRRRLLEDDLLVVDNTNTTVEEMLPYVRLAQAYKVPFEVVTIECNTAVAAARNIHGVPVDQVHRMHERLKAAKLPRDWPQRTVQITS